MNDTSFIMIQLGGVALMLMYIGYVLTKTSIDIERMASRGKMTPEKAERIKSFLELLKKCDGEQYYRVLSEIRRIEAE